MPLADALIALGKDKILKFQAAEGGQDSIRQRYLDLMALDTKGLSALTRSSIDMQDFAEVIEQHRSDLRPWVMVLPAAMGLLGPWESVLMLWANTELPTDPEQEIAAPVEDLLDASFRGYVRLIAI